MAKVPVKPAPKEDLIEEIEEIIETVVDEPPKKPAPMVTKKFENKIDLSPLTEALGSISEKLDQVLKPKEEPKKEEPATPQPPPKKEYRLFDEFDPSIEM